MTWAKYRRGDFDWFFDLVLLPTVAYLSYRAWTEPPRRR